MTDLPPLPELWPYQKTAVEEIADHFNRVNVVFLDGPPGCLTGDTLITVNRGGVGRRMTLERLYKGFNSLEERRNYRWDLSIPTRVQRCVFTGENKAPAVARLGLLKAATYSGRKEVFLLKTLGGRSIKATADHPFCVGLDEFVPLSDLRPGDELLVKSPRRHAKGEKKVEVDYLTVQGLVNHPHRGAWPYKIPAHRLVVEAGMNGLRLDWYLAILRDQNASVEGLSFLARTDVVHHKDHNRQNNALENLEVLSDGDHARHHGVNGGWMHVALSFEMDVIESIESVGVEDTYDLTMDNDPHNFVANDFVVHNCGKSILGEAIRRRCFPERQTLYICSSIYLQEQLLSDPALSHAKLLMGRGNYKPATTNRGRNEMIRQMGITCADCTKAQEQPCSWCDNHFACPYYRARQEAATARLGILNMHYWLTEANHVGLFEHRDFAIVDECDLLDQTLSQFAEIVISARTLENLKLSPPPGKVTGKRTTVEWSNWLKRSLLPATEREAASLSAKLKKMHPTQKAYIGVLRRSRFLAQTISQVDTLVKDLEKGENCGWVRVGNPEREAIWRPIWPTRFAKQVLWRHATKFLLMSGTVVSASEMAGRLGLDQPHEVVKIDSPIDPSRRPIAYLPVARLSKKSPPSDYEKLVYAIRQICDKLHPDERVIVHTVSYDLTRRVVEGISDLPRHVGTYTSSGDVFAAIEQYKAADNPNAILVAPSLERGLDLPGDLGRASIIAKVPYPNLGDAQIAARLHPSTDYNGGQSWYCADEETEALTRRGWLPASEIVAGEDEILTLNPETLASEWNVAESVNIFEPSPSFPMILMEGVSHSSLTTPDHRWLVKVKSRWKGQEEWEWRTTATLGSSCYIPQARPHSGFPSTTTYSDALVELVAWYWTEGSVSKNPDGSVRKIQISQSHRIHPENVNRIRTTLAIALEGIGGWSEYVHPPTDVTYFNLGKAAGAYLDALAPDKVVSPAFLTTLTASQLSLFIETSLDADGCRGRGSQTTISQVSEERIKAFEMACALAGIPTSTHYYPPRCGKKNGMWQTGLTRKGGGFTNPLQAASQKKVMTVTPVEYQGRIWCPATKNKTWLARRRGSVYYTGNTLEALRRIIQMAGRTTRGIDDFSDVYILDASFYERLWKDVQHTVPTWWEKAICWTPTSDMLRLVGILPALPAHLTSSAPAVPLSRQVQQDL